MILDRNKRVFTWGFGGYGRLGHAEQKDEFVPRMIKFFEGQNRGATEIAAGSQFTLAVNEWGTTHSVDVNFNLTSTSIWSYQLSSTKHYVYVISLMLS